MESIHRQWIRTASAVITVLLLEAGLRPAMAQPNQPDTNSLTCQTARYRPEISGPDREWIRLERCENRLQIIHTRQGNENRGVLGVVNLVTDVLGPTAGFTRWYDHSVTRLAFRPDRCPSIAAPENSTNCTITGTETLLLSTEVDIYSGQFTVEYIYGDLLKAVTFRLPADTEWKQD